MAPLLPRLFADVGGLFEPEFPFRLSSMMRVEDTLTDEEYTVRAELPGLDPEKDVTLTVTDGMLVIHAERREEERTSTRSEFRYGVFQRTIRLPANADEEKIAAAYDKGILTVTVPLTAPTASKREIPIGKTG
ncbi:hypothetical protein Val02_50370 [Virgisporangium aliadipatigenens]|uniref:SHSP domain-containing protein n=1 Tax=Virgisporangium aliadipatigenens TaxID=741659 RepID=A0A8J3YMU0_9ACTN|nr:Hsp20/alpha crystallin family protein [Virgisporangium aliadipatigenens]GIJ48151.1 hypothetical protein Val02_50370 [Virgisporangium aliadipatigenens]